MYHFDQAINCSVAYIPHCIWTAACGMIIMAGIAKGQLISNRLVGTYPEFSQKNERKNSTYDTSGRLVFVRFLEEIEDTKKTFQNKLTFKKRR